MTTRYDYEALRLEYVQGDMSIRELARTHEISSWSTVSVQARKGKWQDQREMFRAQMQSREIELMADKKAKLVADIEEDFLKVLHAAILKMGTDMRDRTVKDYDYTTHQAIERVIPGVQVSPIDVTKMVATMQTILGKPGVISEERHLGIDLTALGLDPESLREIARVTAEPVGRAAVRASLPSPRGAGPN